LEQASAQELEATREEARHHAALAAEAALRLRETLEAQLVKATSDAARQIAEATESAQQQLDTRMEQEDQRFNLAKREFEAKIATVVRLNEASSTVAQHKFDEDMAATIAKLRSKVAADAAHSQENAEEHLATVINQKDTHLLEVEKVRATDTYRCCCSPL
jgi:hypothetical protein